MYLRSILVLNGPNLDMLGMCEPNAYGDRSLASLESFIVDYAAERGIDAACYQSNSEGKLINKIHDAADEFDGIVYNPGAHAYYSYAIRDALGAIEVPTVEVHLADADEREEFRRVSVIAPACIAQVRGMGFDGYGKAVDILREERSLVRLGEGYERFFKPSCSVIVASKANRALPVDAVRDDVARDAQEASDDLPEVSPGRAGRAGGPPFKDYASAFAGAVASVDAGLLSYERQAAVRSALMQIGLNSMLVRDTSNIRWVTALDGVFDEERAHALLIGEQGSLLHTDSRYANAIRTAAAQAGSDILVNEERVTHAQFALEAMTHGGQFALSGRLGIEDSITYSEFVKMVEKFQTSSLAPTTDVVLGLRSVKDAGEITRLKAAQAVTDAAFSHIVEFMRPGMTEREVQLELEDFLLRHGGEALSFRSIVATGANGADPHAVPGNTRLEAGQCVVMDFGARAYGYCSDMTRTVFLGRPEGLMSRAWEALRCANETVENYLKPGVTGASAHNLAEQVLDKGGFGNTMGHGLGHGVGLDVHELPVLNPRNDLPLVAGNVVTVEPGIYLAGKFGMRLEDCGVITEEGFEVFTQSTHEMVII